jgi:hypothetical protein
LAAEPAAHEMDEAWEHRHDNDAENEEGQIIFHHGYIAKKISPQNKKADPENTAERAICHEPGIDHSSDARNERRKRSNNREKSRKYYRLAAVLRIEFVRFFQMSTIE